MEEKTWDEWVKECCESPIEQMFLSAWLDLLNERAKEEFGDGYNVRTWRDLSWFAELPASQERTALNVEQLNVIFPQQHVADFRVDFVLGRVVCRRHKVGIPGKPRGGIMVKLPLLIVECDGHDYHERTKEQAQSDKSRDRALTAMGYRVIRFTGSELFRRAGMCAQEVDDLFSSLAAENL